MNNPEEAIIYPWRNSMLEAFPNDIEMHTWFKQLWLEEDKKTELKFNNNNMTYSEEQELYELRKYKAQRDAAEKAAQDKAKNDAEREAQLSKLDPYTRQLRLEVEKQLMADPKWRAQHGL